METKQLKHRHFTEEDVRKAAGSAVYNYEGPRYSDLGDVTKVKRMFDILGIPSIIAPGKRIKHTPAGMVFNTESTTGLQVLNSKNQPQLILVETLSTFFGNSRITVLNANNATIDVKRVRYLKISAEFIQWLNSL